ncbi:SDR family NAD(P)-dependent oxidoreductase [Adlercreutzia murintestinalis]|uniref:SDR family NAD(P)-dependent oxidoreductase n=1 Tax=Adlercreutzia murintestinalis TaxID=2941325 RepID=UPI00203BBBF2|nr:SDR family oxidoreductase [Adlercreutzia murintestinalis]
MKKLEGRVAIVTGASSGVGRGLAKVLAEQGAKICACARRMEKLEELKTELAVEGADVLPVACDVTDPDQIKNVVTQCVEAFGGVDILINCAQGSMAYCEIQDIDIEYAMTAYQSGALATMLFMKECFPYLKESGHGRIINTASAAGYDGNEGFGAYGMAKEAIRAITRTGAREWGKYGITVNVFLPIIATDFFRETQPQALKSLEAKSPLGRIGTTEEDCAPLIVFLVSDEGGYFTGQSFMVDGGIHMHT